jgi:YVTN family beta-propeller protein
MGRTRSEFTSMALLAGCGLALELLAGAVPASGARCPGDCDDDGDVGIEELVVAVNVALALRSPDTCAGLDADGDGAVGVDELVRAVANSIAGCPTPRPNGDNCTAGEQCASGNCVTGFCCVVDHCAPGEFCAPGTGVCTSGPTPTPTATPTTTRTATRAFTFTATQTVAPSVTATETRSATPTATRTSGFRVCAFASLTANELDHSLTFVGTQCSFGSGSGAGAPPPDTVRLDGIPRDVAVSRDGKVAYVTTREPDELAVVDLNTRKVLTSIPDLGVQPEAVGCTPDGSAILVTNFGSNSVAILRESLLRERVARRRSFEPVHRLSASELSTAGVLEKVSVGSNPNALAVSADSASAYVTNYGSASVSVLDIAGATAVKSVNVGDLPNGVALSPDGKFAYVTKFGSSNEQLSIIETGTNEQVAKVPLPGNAEVRPTSLTFAVTAGGESRLLISALGLSLGKLFGTVYVFDFDGQQVHLLDCFDFGPSPSDSLCKRFPSMVGILPSAVAAPDLGTTAQVASFVVDDAGGGRVSATGGKVLRFATEQTEFMGERDVGTFPVGLAAGERSDAPGPTPTPDPNATPTIGERCGQKLCDGPSMCIRDVACHLNGCPPRDKCCPVNDPNCLACKGGANDGAPCTSPAACPGGSCEP